MRRTLLAHSMRKASGLAAAARIYKQSLGRESPLMSLREVVFLTVAAIIALVLITVAASYCVASSIVL